MKLGTKIMSVPVVASAVTLATSALSVFAADEAAGSGSVNKVLTDSFSSIGSDLTDTVLGILPIALPLLGMSIAITFGIKKFKKVTNTAQG